MRMHIVIAFVMLAITLAALFAVLFGLNSEAVTTIWVCSMAVFVIAFASTIPINLSDYEGP